MSVQDNELLSEKLRALEADVRRLTSRFRIAIAVSLVVMFYVLSRDLARSGTAAFDMLRVKYLVTEELHVKGDSSSAIQLSLDGGSFPVMRFYDSRGKGRIIMGIQKSDGQTDLIFYDHMDKPRIDLKVGSEGGKVGGILRFFGSERTSRLELGVNPAGLAGINMYDEQGRTGTAMNMNRGGESHLVLRSVNGPDRVQILAGGEAGPSLHLLDKNNDEYQLVPRKPLLENQE